MTSFTVHCTHCETGFPVDPDKVPDGGVRARCTNCEGIFFVARPLEMPEPAPVVTEPETPDVVADRADASGAATVTEPEASDTEPVEPTEPALVEPTEPEVVEPEVAEPESEVAEPESEVAEFETELEAGPETELEVELPEPELVEPQLDAAPETDPTEEDEPAAELDSGGLDLDDTGFGSFDDEVEAIDSEVGPEGVDVAGGDVAPDEDEDDVAPVPTGFQFGRRDPHDKARRLARVLVSDMITYNPDRHAQALARGTLSDDFEDEIAKSWEEYVDQVGRDMAESTDYWTNALNDVLARGEKVF